MSYKITKDDYVEYQRTRAAANYSGNFDLVGSAFSFSSVTRITGFSVYWPSACNTGLSTLTNNTKLSFQIEVHGEWITIWSQSDVEIPNNRTRKTLSFSGNISSSVSKKIIQYGISQNGMRLVNDGDGRLYVVISTLTFTLSGYILVTPSITTESEITECTTSGSALTVSWSAPTVAGSMYELVYYQIFLIDDASGYPTVDKHTSASLYMNEYTSRSITISEEDLLTFMNNKYPLASGLYGEGEFGTAIFVSVRAYLIDYDDAAHTSNPTTIGNWPNSSWEQFTYKASAHAPTNIAISPPEGKSFTITWENSTAGNTDAVDGTYFYIMTDAGWALATPDNLLNQNSYEYEIPYGTPEGACTFKLTHTYYDRSGDSESIIFMVTGQNTIAIYYDNQWVHCVPYIYDDNAWQMCDPYIYDGNSWVLCSSS